MNTHHILAQTDVGNVPAEIFKWIIVVLIAAVFTAAAIFGIISFFRRQKVEIDAQPVEVSKAPKRFNHDQNEERHKVINAHLTDHEQRIRLLEETTSGMEARIMVDGERRKNELQKEIAEIPSRILADLANAQKIK